jgi:Mycothiol maleylpyruvate isomerase N-terminal domain
LPVAEAYLAAADKAVDMIGQPAVAASWDEPSALAEMSVGALAGHLAYQLFSVSSALDEPASTEPTIPLLDHYGRAAWIGAPLDSDVNAGIRSRGRQTAAEGADALHERAAAALAFQRTQLAKHSGDEAVFLPQTGWALTLDDFLVTRMLELAVHLDDLAVSVGVATPELPDAVFDPVLLVLSRLATRRHGQAAMVRALARQERAPAAINAI